MDIHGHHRAACMRTGRVKKRAMPTERVLARVFREAGARVRFNAFLRDMNVGVPATDTRRIEVLAQDLPCFAGARSGRCRLVVVGIETGGRWSDEAAEVVRQLACARPRDVPCHLSQPAELAWERRWTRMLSTVCAVSFAASLVEPVGQCDLACWTGGEPPTLSDLLAEDPRA